MSDNTSDNLKEAFAGESQANRKYLAFAKQAQKEGFNNLAKLFSAVAEAETVHAHAHLRALGQINKTTENLAEAIEGESFEFKTMYPKFIEEAGIEQNKAAETSFRYANAVEEIHHGLYIKALESIKSGKDIDVEKVYVCPVCGFTAENEAPERCPVCGALSRNFLVIE